MPGTVLEAEDNAGTHTDRQVQCAKEACFREQHAVIKANDPTPQVISENILLRPLLFFCLSKQLSELIFGDIIADLSYTL